MEHDTAAAGLLQGSSLTAAQLQHITTSYYTSYTPDKHRCRSLPLLAVVWSTAVQASLVVCTAASSQDCVALQTKQPHKGMLENLLLISPSNKRDHPDMSSLRHLLPAHTAVGLTLKYKEEILVVW